MWQVLLNIIPRPACSGRSVAQPLSHPRALPCTLSFLSLPRNRHNKNNASVGRSRKTRGATPSAADPLRVFGKTIEITDPARDGAIVLQGKVSWFDPVRSRYCVIEYIHGRSEGDGGSSRRGGGGGGGDAKGWAHWITLDKLVEAKAIGLEKNGTRFALESLVSLEEEEDGGVVDQTESETNTTESDVQDNVRVKIEEQEEDGGKEGEEESITSSSVEEGANSKEDAEQDRSGEQKGRREVVRLEEKQASDKDEAHVLMRGTTVPPAAHEPDPLPQREPQEEVEQTDSQWPPARDSPREESNGAFPVGQNSVPGDSEDGNTATTSIENTKSEPITRRPTQHHQNADVLLPSVQCPETSDSFARYPTRRGRRRCAPSPTLDNNSSFIREGASSLTKRPRLESKDIGGHAGARATVWKPISAPPSPGGGGTVGGGDAPSAVAVSTSVDVNKRTSSPRQSPQEAVGRELGAGSKVSGASCVEPIAERASDSAYSLEAGWPGGMEMLGQVPVMRIRSVPVSGGNAASFKATYFASAYAGATAEISASDKRSARSRFSFPFEELEELNVSHLLRGTLQKDSRFAESFFQAARQSSPGQLGGTRKRERAEEDARDDAKGGANIDRDFRDSERSGAQDEQEESGGVEPEGYRTEEAILVRDTMPPSPRSSEEFSDSMEDGEMKMLPDGRADIMPPSPPDGDMEQDPVGPGNGDQVTEDPNHRPEGALNGDDGQENAADAAEDMEISSDEQSFGSPEEAETASSCCSDEEVMCDIGADLAQCNAAAAAAATLDTAAAPDASLRRPANEGAIATPFPAASEDSPFQQQQQASAGDWENSQYPSAGAASQLVSAGAGQDEVAMQGEVSSEPPPSVSVAVGERPEVLALRRIVREQLQDILRSASKGREAALSSGDGNAVLEKIAADVEEELFGRLYKDCSGGRAYKVCFMGAFVCMFATASLYLFVLNLLT